MRQICLDTETTGMHPDKGDRLVEIGCVEIVGRTLSDKPEHFYHQYINPERDVPADAVAVHGLTTERLAKEPIFSAIVDDFLAFITDAELIIHNAEFDVGFLNMELKKLKKGKIQDYCAKVTDSLAIAREMFPGLRNNLDVLCTRFNIDKSERTLHGALLDAQLLAEVYLAMTRKQGSLLGEQYEAGEAIEPMPNASQLIVATAPADELALHREFIARIEKKCKTGAMWTKVLGTDT